MKAVILLSFIWLAITAFVQGSKAQTIIGDGVTYVKVTAEILLDTPTVTPTATATNDEGGGGKLE